MKTAARTTPNPPDTSLTASTNISPFLTKNTTNSSFKSLRTISNSLKRSDESIYFANIPKLIELPKELHEIKEERKITPLKKTVSKVQKIKPAKEIGKMTAGARGFMGALQDELEREDIGSVLENHKVAYLKSK